MGDLRDGIPDGDLNVGIADTEELFRLWLGLCTEVIVTWSGVSFRGVLPFCTLSGRGKARAGEASRCGELTGRGRARLGDPSRRGGLWLLARAVDVGIIVTFAGDGVAGLGAGMKDFLAGDGVVGSAVNDGVFPAET